MILIIGGAYMGKLDFARKLRPLTGEDIFVCRTSGSIDFSRPCVTRIEEFVYGCVERGEDPVALFEANRPAWQDSILICRDIFCGVVPLDPKERAWRDEAGRLCQYLTKEADRVSRIFCGLEQRLK